MASEPTIVIGTIKEREAAGEEREEADEKNPGPYLGRMIAPTETFTPRFGYDTEHGMNPDESFSFYPSQESALEHYDERGRYGESDDEILAEFTEATIALGDPICIDRSMQDITFTPAAAAELIRRSPNLTDTTGLRGIGAFEKARFFEERLYNDTTMEPFDQWVKRIAEHGTWGYEDMLALYRPVRNVTKSRSTTLGQAIREVTGHNGLVPVRSDPEDTGVEPVEVWDISAIMYVSHPDPRYRNREYPVLFDNDGYDSSFEDWLEGEYDPVFTTHSIGHNMRNPELVHTMVEALRNTLGDYGYKVDLVTDEDRAYEIIRSRYGGFDIVPGKVTIPDVGYYGPATTDVIENLAYAVGVAAIGSCDAMRTGQDDLDLLKDSGRIVGDKILESYGFVRIDDDANGLWAGVLAATVIRDHIDPALKNMKSDDAGVWPEMLSGSTDHRAWMTVNDAQTLRYSGLWVADTNESDPWKTIAMEQATSPATEQAAPTRAVENTADPWESLALEGMRDDAQLPAPDPAAAVTSDPGDAPSGPDMN